MEALKLIDISFKIPLAFVLLGAKSMYTTHIGIMNNRNLVLLSLIIVGMATRFIPHIPNFTAVGAVALFGGAMYKNGFKAFLIPLITLFISDLILNNVIYSAYFSGFEIISAYSLIVYAGFMVTVAFGYFFTKGFKTIPLIGAAVASTLAFYLITNFGAWLNNPIYTKDFAGLMQSYIAGLPFLANQMLGMAFYGVALFSAAYYLIDAPKTKTVKS